MADKPHYSTLLTKDESLAYAPKYAATGFLQNTTFANANSTGTAPTGSPKFVRWSISINNSQLNFRDDMYLEGELVFVKVWNDAATAISATMASRSVGIGVSNVFANITMPANSSRIYMIWKGSARMEYGFEWNP